MEMSGSCPRPILAARPVRGPHGGWQQREIDVLKARVSDAASAGESLRSVFESVAAELGRKPNSIRNYYYAQLREKEDGDSPRPLPFETFTQEEVESLIRSVLTARAQGMSVRACVRRLSGGDKSRMLRYQNKYRSTIRTRPDLVRAIMEQLSSEGIPFVSPYPEDSVQLRDVAMPRIQTRTEAMGDAQLSGFFDGLNHLLDLALTSKNPVQEAQRSTFPAESEAQRQADRLAARCDMLRIALCDEQQRANRLRETAGDMVSILKEFVGLPEGERPAHAQAFCRQAAERLAAMECALEV